MKYKKIKILIVEDSITIRNLLFQAFSGETDIEIVSYASNGKLAIPRIKFYKPDFVILDYEMPIMDGIETIREIKKQNIETNILMFSSHTKEGAEITIEALKEGAIDFVPKPDIKLYNEKNLIDYIKNHLIQKIYNIYYKKHIEFKEIQKENDFNYTIKPQKIHSYKKLVYDIEVAGIGISTGGPMVLFEMFKMIPKLKKTIFIVQHMPPIFTQKLAESLQKISQSTIIEAKDNIDIEKGTVYIAPGGYHMIVKNNKIKIIDEPPRNNCKPSVDYLFESIAEEYKERAMGIIMTGMGIDGYDGIKKMYNYGCYTVAQSPESCTVYGMPKKPIEENLIHEILNPMEIAELIKKILC